MSQIKVGTTLRITYAHGEIELEVVDPRSTYRQIRVASIQSCHDRPAVGWVGHIHCAYFLGSSLGQYIVRGMDLMVFMLAPDEINDDDGYILLSGVTELAVDGERVF